MVTSRELLQSISSPSSRHLQHRVPCLVLSQPCPIKTQNSPIPAHQRQAFFSVLISVCEHACPPPSCALYIACMATHLKACCNRMHRIGRALVCECSQKKYRVSSKASSPSPVLHPYQQCRQIIGMHGAASVCNGALPKTPLSFLPLLISMFLWLLVGSAERALISTTAA